MPSGRDTQRSKVYAWERADIWPDGISAQDHEPEMSLEECLIFIARVWQDYTTAPPPRVRQGRRGATARGGRYRITLPTWAQNKWVILHELAHALLAYRQSIEPWHGPEFARHYIDLLATYLKVSKTELTRSARKRKIKVGQEAACPRRIRRRSNV